MSGIPFSIGKRNEDPLWPVRHQAITCTNVDPNQCPHMVLKGHTEWDEQSRESFAVDIIVKKSFTKNICDGNTGWYNYEMTNLLFNTVRPWRNCCYFAGSIFKCIFFSENIWISLKISLKLVPKVWNSNNTALVQIMAWRWPDDKPLPEPMMVSLLTRYSVFNEIM